MPLNATRNSIVMDQLKKAELYSPVKADETEQQIMLISAYGELQAFCQSAQESPWQRELLGTAQAALLIVDNLLDTFESLRDLRKND